MTSASTTASAYPMPVDELTDRVREHATRIQAWPSLRQVMTEHRVGRPKAAAAVDALRATGFDPTTATSTLPDTPTADPVPPVLHVVPPAADTTDPDTETDDGQALDVAPSTPVEHSRTPGGPYADQPDDPTRTASADDRPDAPEAGESSPVTDRVDAPTDAPTDTPVEAPAGRVQIGVWPLVLIALGAFVSIWGGWVGLGELTGFGPIRLLPGIADQVVINSAITLPIGVEAYAAFALRAWLAPAVGVSEGARRFARRSAVGALVLGAAGQIAYHLMIAAGVHQAPWPITAFVSCLPVVVLGCGAALTHLIHHTTTGKDTRR